MSASTWYTTTPQAAVDRLLAAWPDAPIENLETLGFILSTARDQVLAYAPTPPAGNPAPYTLNVGGVTWTFDREGDIVHLTAPPTPQADTVPLPEGVRPGAIYYDPLVGGAVVPTSVIAASILEVYTAVRSSSVVVFAPDSVTRELWYQTDDPDNRPDAPADWDTAPPSRYVYAQLRQAENLWNAGRVQVSGDLGDGQYVFTPRPLDKTIQQIIRPPDRKPHAL